MSEASPSRAGLRSMTGGWWIAALVGVVSVIAGVIVLAKPSNSLATLAVVTGIFVLLDGIVALVEAIGVSEHRGVVAVLGVVSVVIGILLIRHPVAGVTAVALLLGLWLIAAAAVRVVGAVAVGEHVLRRLAVAAVLAIAGIAIVSSPHIGYATLALIVGLAFIGYGATMIVLAAALRSVGHEVPAAAGHSAVTT
jgi:uncharacterized membrane protein HdeD (DUF308 family)